MRGLKDFQQIKMSRCLALNRSFIPIKIVSKYNAICKLFTNNAVALTFDKDNYIELDFDKWSKWDKWPEDQEFISSPSIKIAVPRIIRYNFYDKIPRVTLRLTRKNIYERDNNTCYICGKKFTDKYLTIDHIIPLSRDGGNSWNNLITCCQQCNWKKEDKLLSELGWKPKFLAKKPIISNIQKLKCDNRDFEEWKFFGI